MKNEDDTKVTKPVRLPVAKDVARLAGVSIATVSRALNGSEKIRPETRATVLKAASDLGFVVNNAARALSTRRSYAVGAIVPSLKNEVFVRALSSFQKILRQSGYQTIVASTDYDIDIESREARFLMSNGVDGLMLVGVYMTPTFTSALDKEMFQLCRALVFRMIDAVWDSIIERLH